MSEEVKVTKPRRRRRSTKKKETPVVETPTKVETVEEPSVEEVTPVETPTVTDTPETPSEAPEEPEVTTDVETTTVEEETLEEPKEEPKPIKESVTTLDKNSVPYIEKTIKEAKTVEDIFDNLSESEMVSSLINKLKTYRKRMIEKHTEKEGVNQQYLMYNTILEILNEKNYGVFNVKFRLLNKIFTIGKDGVFSNIKLSRYDYHWRWGVKTHETYFKLVSIITTLCDGATRSKNIKTIDFNKGIDNLTSTAKQNLIKYYS